MKKQIKKKVMGELYGGTNEWGLELDEEHADLLVDYMVNKPDEIAAFLK
ncbi:MAG: hypothetical protein HFH14_01635 [Lachnospiraceae bacterium]|nr:hypothetical protein [Lachnospiraceae bacterium]